MMVSTLRRFLKSHDGAVAVEMAMVALPLTMLIFGSIEFGRAHWAAQALQDAAVRAVRCVGIMQSECGENGSYSIQRSKAYAVEVGHALGLAIDPSHVMVDTAATCGDRSGFARVTLSYEFRTPLEGLLESLGKGVTLKAEACFPNQG